MFPNTLSRTRSEIRCTILQHHINPLDRNYKYIFIAPLESAAQPVEVPLAHGGEAFWLDGRTIGLVVVEGNDSKVASLYAISVRLTGASLDATADLPLLLGKFPTASPSSFRYAAKAGLLVFSDNVYEDGELTKVTENDRQWDERGNTALVYDDTYERHWDTWTGPKRPSLFTVKLSKDAENKWHFGGQYTNVLHGTRHVGGDKRLPSARSRPSSTHPSSRLVARAITTCLMNTSFTPRRTRNFPKPGIPSKTLEFRILASFRTSPPKLNIIDIPRPPDWQPKAA